MDTIGEEQMTGWRTSPPIAFPQRSTAWRMLGFAPSRHPSGEETMQRTENTAALLGRIAMSVIFILAGWGKLLAPAATQAMLAHHNLALVQLGWILAVVVELGGGLAILFGFFTRPVALVLALWCVATALIAHTNFADRNQEINFLKNVAMTGGFLYVAAFGARAWSLDAWWSRRRGAAP
jgi:putative oxidoreductase